MNATRSGLLRRLLGRAGDRQRGFAEAGVALTGAALVLGAALGSGVASTVVNMSDGVTWLPDGETGQVVQVNPATGRAERRLQVAGPGGELGISQRDGHLLVVDEATGTVRSIDLATLLEGGARRTDEPARVLVGGGRVYLVTLGDGVVRAVDPLTLKDVATPYRAGGRVADAVVDEQGAVWLATVTGDLRSVRWLPGESRWDVGGVRRLRGAGAGTRLLPHARGVTVFAPDRSTVLQVGVGKDVSVAVPDLRGEVLPATVAPPELAPAGVPARSAVVILAGSRVLDVAVGALGCSRPGSPAVFAGLVHVPCTGDGRVVVLGPDGRRARPDVVVPAGRDPRLIVDDGRLVVHTEDGSRAVVVESDGRTRVIDTGRSQAPLHDPRDGGGSGVSARPPVGGQGPGRGGPGSDPGGHAPGGPAPGPAPGGPGEAPGPGTGPGDTGAGGPGRGGLAAPRGGGTTAPAPGRVGGTPRPAPGAPEVAAPSDVQVRLRDPDDAGLSDAVVSWRAASSRPDAYVVRSTAPGVAPVEVDGGTTRVTVRGLVCGLRGTFTVEAVDDLARSAAAESDTFRTPECAAAPDAPTGVTATVGTDGKVTVSWDAPPEAVDGFVVGPDGGSATTVAGDATSVVLTDVPPGTGVRIGVQAVRDRLTSATTLSSAVDVPGPPGSAGPVAVTLRTWSERQLGVVVRWSQPETNGSPLISYDIAYSGAGAEGSMNVGAVTGCSGARGCGAGGGTPRTELSFTIECACTHGPLTVTVTPRNGVGAGPSSSGAVVVPEVTPKTSIVNDVTPVEPGLTDPDVHMVVRLAEGPPFATHDGTCVLDIEHSNGTHTSAPWSCHADSVVVGPFPPGLITVYASTVVYGDGGGGHTAAGFTATVPDRSAWPYCDPRATTCAAGAALPDTTVQVVPVPWSPRLPAGEERAPVAATGAGLVLAAAVLHLRRRGRGETAAPSPVTPEENPA